MDTILALALALGARALPKEELRFLPVLEQRRDASCGLAAVSSLLALYCSIPADEEELAWRLASRYAARGAAGRDGTALGISLADIGFLLAEAGLRSRAYRMALPELEAALDSGFAPILVHYSRPEPHFALLLARADAGGFGPILALADPARGIEALSPGDFARRWSGAAILVDPSALSPAGRGLLDAALEGCIARMGILARGEAACAAFRSALGASGGFEAGGRP